uniref:Uncharacterized protein n=1 Tax=Rhipicephalus microplus TaxID=6941 RepID=A0A6G5AIB1_RHIMP
MYDRTCTAKMLPQLGMFQSLVLEQERSTTKFFFFNLSFFFFIFRCGTTSWIVRYCLTDFMEQETRCVPIAVCLILLLLSVLPSCSVDFFFSFCFVLVFSKLFVSLSW